MKSTRVIATSKDDKGDIIGSYHENPLLNSIIYDVKFPDGEVKEYAANVIAQNMYSQVDENGKSSLLLDSILDHAKNASAVPIENKYVVTRSGHKRLRKTQKAGNYWCYGRMDPSSGSPSNY